MLAFTIERAARAAMRKTAAGRAQLDRLRRTVEDLFAPFVAAASGLKAQAGDLVHAVSVFQLDEGQSRSLLALT